jgi:hypothetical protein
MSQYLLLLYHDPAIFQRMSPDEHKAAEEKYRAWTQQPGTIDARRLDDGFGRVVRANNGAPHVTDGPYSETKEHLGGFYLIEADSYDAAVEATKIHPHVHFGGTVEIRKLWEKPQ